MTKLSYLNALPSALVAVDTGLTVTFLNPAAEALLATGAPHATGQALSALPGFDEELCALCKRVLATGEGISLFDRTLRLPFNHCQVTLHLEPVEGETPPQLLIVIDKIAPDRLPADGKREATRAVGLMAAMLAHEVKNPLAGIRGAAQLLASEVSPEHKALAELVCAEVDRIRDLLVPVEIFAPQTQEEAQAVNIHEVLQYVIQVAKTGFARNIAFKERYDPSLPPVLGRRDLLVQLFLNLVKNAAEAMAGRKDAAITLITAYRSGRKGLPVAVSVEDNGPGIPEDVRPRLFEPFVSSREEGRGLGLAVVAKIASDLGAAIELDPDFAAGTRFTLWLPVAD